MSTPEVPPLCETCGRRHWRQGAQAWRAVNALALRVSSAEASGSRLPRIAAGNRERAPGGTPITSPALGWKVLPPPASQSVKEETA